MTSVDLEVFLIPLKHPTSSIGLAKFSDQHWNYDILALLAVELLILPDYLFPNIRETITL